MLAQYIREKGRKKGRQETVIAFVRNAGKNGLSEEMIAQIIDLDVNLARQILIMNRSKSRYTCFQTKNSNNSWAFRIS